MNLENIESFLLYNCLLNAGILSLWGLALVICPKIVYKSQVAFIPIREEDFIRIFYLLVGFYKIFFFIFCLGPLLAFHLVF